MSWVILSNLMNIVTDFVYIHSLCQNESSFVIRNHLFIIFCHFSRNPKTVSMCSAADTQTHSNAPSMERALMRESSWIWRRLRRGKEFGATFLHLAHNETFMSHENNCSTVSHICFPSNPHSEYL